MERRILQIMPAAGWVAKSNMDDGSFYEEPLVGWALVEGIEGTEVIGLYAQGESYCGFVDEIGNFSHYSYLPSHEPPKGAL